MCFFFSPSLFHCVFSDKKSRSIHKQLGDHLNITHLWELERGEGAGLKLTDAFANLELHMRTLVKFRPQKTLQCANFGLAVLALDGDQRSHLIDFMDGYMSKFEATSQKPEWKARLNAFELSWKNRIWLRQQDEANMAVVEALVGGEMDDLPELLKGTKQLSIEVQGQPVKKIFPLDFKSYAILRAIVSRWYTSGRWNKWGVRGQDNIFSKIQQKFQSTTCDDVNLIKTLVQWWILRGGNQEHVEAVVRLGDWFSEGMLWKGRVLDETNNYQYAIDLTDLTRNEQRRNLPPQMLIQILNVSISCRLPEFVWGCARWNRNAVYVLSPCVFFEIERQG